MSICIDPDEDEDEEIEQEPDEPDEYIDQSEAKQDTDNEMMDHHEWPAF